MRLVYLGTPEFAVPSLEALIHDGHDVALVVTQPDRPKGRGQQLGVSPVKQCALRHGLDVFQPERVRRPESVDRLALMGAEIMAVVGYGQIIPQSILDLPPRGIINVHASLLPKYRGAAPVQWAVANGETRTGVTTMRIDAGLDTGDLLLRTETGIGPDETAVQLGERLARAGAALLVETLRGLESGLLTLQPQNHAEATLAPILKKEDGRIEWSWPARTIHNRARGLQPWPGAYTLFRGQNFQIWQTRLAEPAGLAPGALMRAGKRLLAGAGDGLALELVEVQPEGKRRMNGLDFANGQRLADHESFGEPL